MLIPLQITMRGTERPRQVLWTRPFLQPLTPLSHEAAKETFLDIADDVEDDNQFHALLKLTDNIPLALTLLANLVAVEGCTDVLHRWKSDTTSMLSDGIDRQSNLDHSIAISLSSPRMLAVPQALQLLSVLSILPDGLSDIMLTEIQFPFQELLGSKTALLRTSLAYLSKDGRLRTLVPIREYVLKAYPPTSQLIEPLRKYLYELVGLSESFRYSLASGIVARIAIDMGNIQSLLALSLKEDANVLKDTLQCILKLAKFSYHTNIGSFELLHSIQDLVESFDDPNLLGDFLVVLVRTQQTSPAVLQPLYLRAVECFKSGNNFSGLGRS